jgi:hypothetical protein
MMPSLTEVFYDYSGLAYLKVLIFLGWRENDYTDFFKSMLPDGARSEFSDQTIGVCLVGDATVPVSEQATMLSLGTDLVGLV